LSWRKDTVSVLTQFPWLSFGLGQSQISQQHVCCVNSLLLTKHFCSFAKLAQNLICCC